MSSISKIVFSLSLLTIVSLHAMEENNISYRRRGKQQITKENVYNDFRHNATGLIMQQTIHILTGSEFPYSSDMELYCDDRYKLAEDACIESTEDAESIITSNIESFFSDQIRSLMQTKNSDKMTDILMNGTKIYIKKKQNPDNNYIKNDFSKLILAKNLYKFCDEKNDYQDVIGEDEMYDFNLALLVATQKAVSSHSVYNIISKNKNLAGQLQDAQNKIKHLETKNAKLNKARKRWKITATTGIPAAFVVGGVVATGVMYKAGIIDAEKTAELAGKATSKFSTNN